MLQNGVLSRIYVDGDIDVSMSLNLNDSSDPTNFNIKVDGSVLKNNIATLQNSMYVFNCGSYTVLNIQHSFGISMAVTSTVNPSSSEIFNSRWILHQVLL